MPDDVRLPKAQLAAQLAQRLVEVQVEVAELELRLKQAQRAEQYLAETALPETLFSLGISGLPLLDGSWVEAERKIHANIPVDWPEEKREAAFKILDERRAGPLIKHEVSIQFERGMGESVRRLVNALRTRFPEQKIRDYQVIQWNTLTAWVKEQLALGEELPLDALGAYNRWIARVKSKRKEEDIS